MYDQQTFLYQKTTLYLAQLISENLGISAYKLPTEMEIAALQGVSRITVRKAFKELCDLNLLTRIKGKGTYINKNTTREMLSPFLQTNSLPDFKKIALILPLPITNSQHLAEIFSAVLEATSDMKLLVASSNMSLEREQLLIKEYMKMNVDGIILYPIDNDVYNPTLIQLATSSFPIVLVDRYLPGLDFGYVSSDHKTAITVAVEHLLERGHEHILFFNSNIKTNTTLTVRQESYISTLSNYNNYNNYFFTFNGDSDPTSKSFCEKFKQYLAAHPNLTSIITADYASGLHLIQMFKQMHLSYQDKFEIVFLDFKSDESQLVSGAKLPTFVEQNSFKLGLNAVKLLKLALIGKNIRNTSQLIPVNLIQGYSTRQITDEEKIRLVKSEF
ncbi:MAG: substrate-binding domain-containing protein [Clostridia bacterium]|nr:substrate-binding domain-containing protein [Clostridia bacterium]